MLSWTQKGPFPGGLYDLGTHYELHADVDDRKYVISASTLFPEDVCVALMVEGREFLSHEWWSTGRKACGDRVIRSVSDAKNVAEEWEAAEVWRHWAVDLADPTTVSHSEELVGFRFLPSEPGTVSFECITENGAYWFDCVPQATWNRIADDMRQANERGEDFEPVMQAWLRMIEADFEGDEGA